MVCTIYMATVYSYSSTGILPTCVLRVRSHMYTYEHSVVEDTTTRTTALSMDMLVVSVCTPAYSSCALSLAHVYTDTTSSTRIVAPVSQVATVPDTTTCKSEPVIVPM